MVCIGIDCESLRMVRWVYAQINGVLNRRWLRIIVNHLGSLRIVANHLGLCSNHCESLQIVLIGNGLGGLLATV